MRIKFSQRKKDLKARLNRVMQLDYLEGTLGTVGNYVKYGDFWWRCVAMPNWKED